LTLCHTINIKENEMQNIHLEHPEDCVLTGNLDVLDWFVNPGTLSLKVDGAPAVCWGIDPSCGEFFVGTKAVFNKKKIRIAHSHEEINLFYQGDVAEILHACFDYLPRTETIYQADFLGFGGEEEYTSNVITYQFDDIVTQNIIIAPHTCYYAENDLRDAVAMPDRAIWNDTNTVKFVQPKAYILYNQESFADVEEVCNFARQMSTTCTFVSGKQLTELKKAINACIREQREIEDDAFDCDANLIRLWKLVRSITQDCLFLCRNDGPAAYIGHEQIDAEGYVLTNEFGMYKLVNREVFSYANFNQSKAWSK
jgi:hypothetical protein